MNISKYDFHDGYLIDLVHDNRNIILTLESAQINETNIPKKDLALSKHKTLKGKLHIENICSLKINDKPGSSKLTMMKKEGDVFEFSIHNNTVLLTIRWIQESEQDSDEWYRYEIEAEKIYWENIPDLHNPFWT